MAQKQFLARHDTQVPAWMFDHEDDLIGIANEMQEAGAEPQHVSTYLTAHAVALLAASGMPNDKIVSLLSQVVRESAFALVDGDNSRSGNA